MNFYGWDDKDESSPCYYNYDEYKPRHYCANHGHEAVENGTRNSWCRYCDVNMRYDFNLGWIVK